MKFYLIDDDASVCNILKIIIQQKKLGEVCGSASNGVDALEDLRFIHPDIIIVDLLMPIMDGINFVRKAKEQYPDICYVMLSQVSSKEMVAQAYECGVTFFLQKPVNSVEVVRVLTNVVDSIQMKRTSSRCSRCLCRAGRKIWLLHRCRSSSCCPSSRRISRISNACAGFCRSWASSGRAAARTSSRWWTI